MFRSGLPQPLSSQKKKIGLIKAGVTQTETSLLKQYVASECVDLLDDYIGAFGRRRPAARPLLTVLARVLFEISLSLSLSLSLSPSFHVHLFLNASMAQHKSPYACAEAHDCLRESLIFGSGYVGMNAELLLVVQAFFVCFPPARIGSRDFRGRVTKNLLFLALSHLSKGEHH